MENNQNYKVAMPPIFSGDYTIEDDIEVMPRFDEKKEKRCNNVITRMGEYLEYLNVAVRYEPKTANGTVANQRLTDIRNRAYMMFQSTTSICNLSGVMPIESDTRVVMNVTSYQEALRMALKSARLAENNMIEILYLSDDPIEIQNVMVLLTKLQFDMANINDILKNYTQKRM